MVTAHSILKIAGELACLFWQFAQVQGAKIILKQIVVLKDLEFFPQDFKYALKFMYVASFHAFVK